jgi:GNAT superfamily N-acetyltransferase
VTIPTIVYTDAGRNEDREPILQALIAYNRSRAPDPKFQMLGLLLKDEAGATIGGLWGRSAYEWLFIELLFVPEFLRGTGLGSTLIQQAEQVARDRGCTGVWLDTFAFQALPLYQKLGYTVFGELKDHPRGISQYWLQKRLGSATSSVPGSAP